MSSDYINPQEDDVVNGIANSFSNQYSISLNHSSIEGLVGGTLDLDATVTLKDIIVSRNLTWKSDDESVVTVDGTGMVTFVSDGSATITCHIQNNPSVFDTCSVIVSSTPTDTYQVVYTPEINRIVEGDSVIWNFYLYKNGIIQGNTFTFTLTPNTVPLDHYVYLPIDGNSLAIQNMKMYLDDHMTLNATSGIHSVDIDVYLVGKW